MKKTDQIHFQQTVDDDSSSTFIITKFVCTVLMAHTQQQLNLWFKKKTLIFFCFLKPSQPLSSPASNTTKKEANEEYAYLEHGKCLLA